MADNIKIVGNIVSTSNTTRYSSEDTNLISSTNIKENFGEIDDYIEYYIYDNTGILLRSDNSYLNYKLPTNIAQTPGANTPPNITGNIQTDDVGIVSTLTTSSALYPIIEIDPIKDIQNYGYSSGEFRTVYNLFQNKISDSNNRALFVQEISKDRTEIRLKSTTLQDSDIESIVTGLINELEGSTYQVYYLLNFGNNEQYIAVNIALNKATDGYEILFKLYQPLPLSVQLKSTLWVVEEKVIPYQFSINLDKIVTPPPPPSLRGPNFDIEIPNNGTISTEYNTYSNLISSVQALQQTSYHQILNLMATQSVDINIDYTDYNNFVFFGSAYQRISNFYTKAKQIEDYNTLINTYTPLSSSKPNLITEINQFSSAINTLIAQFDGYEYYLYFESSSYAWPKSSSTKPYSLLSTSSLTVQNWYTATTSSAYNYDYNNYDNLEYAIPVYLKDDTNNAPFLLFLNMVGHYFDNTWIYLKSITDINRANNNLEEGISKDLVYDRLASLGVHLYNTQAGENVNQYLIGANTGSSEWDNNTTITGSYLNNIPRKDLVSELYKRIYHNLPLLVKTKGTVSGLEHLITTFGISGSILNVKEYGGANKTEQLKGYNTDKVRIVSNTITGSILSHELSLQPPYQSSTDFIDEDTHYVDISFSPQNQIDTYISGAITSNVPTWSLDDYIGDPRQQYSSSYIDLDNQRKLYFETGVTGYPGFTGSLMDYNGFIRLIQYFDNSLFKMLEDFTPERTSLSTGVTFNSPVLERNKVVYANPSNSTTQSVPSGEVSASTISSTYGNFYNALSSSDNTMGWFDGEISGSTVNVNQYFTDNYNPYLGDWNVWNAQHSITESINTNTFEHSDWNVLLNNVSNSIQSNIRKKIEYTGNYLPTGSLTSSAELQDSYLSLRSYNTSRYEGSKVTSKLYNTYTSASFTYGGDLSYGKTAAIDRNSYKVGWVKNIPSQSLNFYDKTQIQLKYLVDKDLNILDLSLRNNNLSEVQNTFKSGDRVVVSLSDTIQPSYQKTLDGTKLIYRGGYSFDPILYREGREKLVFRHKDYFFNGFFCGISSFDPNYYIGYKGGTTWEENPITYDQASTTPPAPTMYYTTYTTNWPYTNANKPWLSKSVPSSYYWDGVTIPRAPVDPNGFPSWNLWAYNQSIIAPNPTVYAYNVLKFNDYTTNSPDSYNTENQYVVNVNNGVSVLYKAPVASTYRVSATFNVWFDHTIRAINWNSPQNDQTTQIQVYGDAFKIFGILEKRPGSDATPYDGDTGWTYVASTRIVNFEDYSTPDDRTQSSGLTDNIIHHPGSLGDYDEEDKVYWDRIACKLLPDDNTQPSWTHAYGSSIEDPTEFDIVLAQNEVLRFRIFIVDVNNMLASTTYMLGSPSTQDATNINPIQPFSLSPTFFRIYDINRQNLVYDFDETYPAPAAYDDRIFTCQNDYFLFDAKIQKFLDYPTLFYPSPSSSVLDRYTPVIDILSFQPQDIIRLGSINNPIPDYYTVIKTEEIAGTLPYRLTAGARLYRNQTRNGQNLGLLQIYLYQDSVSRPYFESIFNNTTSRQFKITGTYYQAGYGYPANPPYNPQANENQIFTIYELPYITTPVGSGYSILWVWLVELPNLTTSNKLPTETEFGVPHDFEAISPNPTGTCTKVTVDKQIINRSNALIDDSFAILRPKPDETSVIIEFKKESGDVSQAILIPQDASEEIKNSIGNIYQNLNVNLS
jgi:hypothetical protein